MQILAANSSSLLTVSVPDTVSSRFKIFAQNLHTSQRKSVFQRFLHFYSRHRKLCWIGLSLALLVLLFLRPEIAHAAADSANDGESLSDTMKAVNDIFNMLIRLSAAWLWPVIMMIGSLLDNDLIFGGAMGDRLLEIWVQIRNLVNIAFVLILLAIALYNVLGLGEEGGGSPLALKTAVPKFVIALIAVNFSFIGVKVLLDFTNVITGAVFALPSAMVDQQDLNDRVERVICGTQNKQMPMRPIWCDKDKLNERAKAFFSRLDRSNITIAYAVRFGRAPQLKFIRDGLNGIGQLGFNIIFNTTLYVVYAVSFLVLFLVLLLRLVVLWVVVVLSPILALGIVLPNLKELAGEGGGLQEKFVANAIAPIKIGLVLCIGYIMLDTFDVDKSIHGELLSSSSLEAVDPNAIPTDINDLQQLMIAVAMVVILWKGVFDGLDKTAAGAITETIKGTMEGFGKFMAKLPTLAPIIPGGPGESKQSLSQVMDRIRQTGAGIEMKHGRYQGGENTEALLAEWESALKRLDLKKFAEVFARNPHLIRQEKGFEMLQRAVADKDPGAAAQLKNLGKDNNPQAIWNVLYNSKAPAAEEIKKATDATEFTARVNAGDSRSKAHEEAQKPVVKADVIKALVDKKANPAYSNVPSAKTGDIGSKLASFTNEMQTAVVQLESNETLNVNLTETNLVAAMNLLKVLGNEKATSGEVGAAVTAAVTAGLKEPPIKAEIDRMTNQALKKVALDTLTPPAGTDSSANSTANSPGP